MRASRWVSVRGERARTQHSYCTGATVPTFGFARFELAPPPSLTTAALPAFTRFEAPALGSSAQWLPQRISDSICVLHSMQMS